MRNRDWFDFTTSAERLAGAEWAMDGTLPEVAQRMHPDAGDDVIRLNAELERSRRLSRIKDRLPIWC